MGAIEFRVPRKAIRRAKPVILIAITIATWFVMPSLLPLMAVAVLFSVPKRWFNPLALLMIGAAAWLFLPGLLPLVAFGFLIALLGEGLVAFSLAVAGGVGLSLLYPHLFGWKSYNGGHGVVSFTDFIMNPMDSVIVGLLFLNAFFLLMFGNRHFKKYALPMIRSKLRSSSSRLGWGWGLGLLNFCDDLAAGGIINRLYQSDIQSPGVSESFKRRMLVMVLLLGNSFPALIPMSSWTAFYGKVDTKFLPGQFAYIMLPLVLALYCFCIVFNSRRRFDSRIDQDRRPVIGVDFLRERKPPDPGMNGWLMFGIMAAPLFIALVVLVICNWLKIKDSFLYSFAIGLLIQVFVVTGLGWWEHYRRRGASPVVESVELESACDGASTALRGLRELQRRLINSPLHSETQGPLLCEDPRAAVRDLNRSIRLAADVQRSLVRLPICQERLHPALPAEAPFFQRLDRFWSSQTDKLLSGGITEMVSALLKVYLMLILAEATKVCFGQAVDGKKKNSVEAMLTGDAQWLGWAIDWLGPGERQAGAIVDWGILAVGGFIVAILWGLRHLRLSSAWGVLAIIWPLVAVILDGMGYSRAEGQLSLVHACFFGLVLSFGVWCNSTLKTGDNVAIAAEIQELDPEELVKLSNWTASWPLAFSAFGLIVALAFHPVLEKFPSWCVWCVLPLGWAAISAWLSFLLTRNRLLAE